jgi:hypothetical protein
MYSYIHTVSWFQLVKFAVYDAAKISQVNTLQRKDVAIMESLSARDPAVCNSVQPILSYFACWISW